MQILQQGRIEKHPDAWLFQVIVVCPKCGGRFSFDAGDMLPIDASRPSIALECPCCRAELRLDKPAEFRPLVRHSVPMAFVARLDDDRHRSEV